MKLFEHPDFEQAILRAAEYFAGRGLRPAILEKDYYVTEAPCVELFEQGKPDDRWFRTQRPLLLRE